MKILHIINHLAKGGAERLLVDVLPLYKKEEHEIKVLQLSDKHASSEYMSMLKEANIPVFSLTSGSLYDPKLIFKLKKFIQESHFDIVHVHLFPAMYWASLSFKLLKKKPVFIFTEHSTQNNRLNNVMFKPIDGFIYRSYDEVVVISPAIEDKLKTWVPAPNKLKLIRNGVNTSHFKNAVIYDRSFFENEFSIPPDAVILLMTARFLYPKDHVTVVDTLKYLPSNYHIIFAGEGEGKDNVQQHSTSLGFENRIHFAGFRTDVPSLMKSVDFNILASKYEGMSGVTLEALAAGKPFLGSNVPGINDVVPDERFLFQDGNPQYLAEKISEIVLNKSLKDQIVKDGLDFVSKFDVSIMIEKHLELYNQIILNKGKRVK
jgi:glycosyltransferase involved in cell wall biosynthesis